MYSLYILNLINGLLVSWWAWSCIYCLHKSTCSGKVNAANTPWVFFKKNESDVEFVTTMLTSWTCSTKGSSRRLGCDMCWSSLILQCWPIWKPFHSAKTWNCNSRGKEHGLWGDHASCTIIDDWCIWKLCCTEGILSYTELSVRMRILIVSPFSPNMFQGWSRIQSLTRVIFLVFWAWECRTEEGVGW